MQKLKAIDLQWDCFEWARRVFADDVVKDVNERCLRFLEESIELAQSLCVSPEEIHALVDYVYSRDKGEAHREIGGIMVTLSVLACVINCSIARAWELELTRIQAPEVIRRVQKRQKEKRHVVRTRRATY